MLDSFFIYCAPPTCIIFPPETPWEYELIISLFLTSISYPVCKDIKPVSGIFCVKFNGYVLISNNWGLLSPLYL